jgi:hypothetical protein
MDSVAWLLYHAVSYFVAVTRGYSLIVTCNFAWTVTIKVHIIRMVAVMVEESKSSASCFLQAAVFGFLIPVCMKIEYHLSM